jgi:DNA-binding PadR family transcriptional regulator
MTTETGAKRSPLALVVLALLDEAPMHPYRMQQLIEQRGKHEVVNIRQRASLYQTIDRLRRDGLIAVKPARPGKGQRDRTVYRLTELGRRTGRRWLSEILSTPSAEFPEFPAAISFIYLLAPREAATRLDQRARTLAAERDRIDRVLRDHADLVPRLFLLELELKRAEAAAELGWIAGVVEDLKSGRLTWSRAHIRQLGQATPGSLTPAAERVEG